MKPFLDGKQLSGLTSLASASAGDVATPSQGAGAAVLAAREAAAIKAPFGNHSIDVVKEGDKVVRLVITCACGERMEVECIYPTGA